MLNLSKLSKKYRIKNMGEEDVAIILNLQQGNPLYFEYCPPKPSAETVLSDLKELPEGKSFKDKFYIAFPQEDTIYIGLFMVDVKESKKGVGSKIIEESLAAFKKEGYKKVRLAYMKGNFQSRSFWRKCGFVETGIEKENNRGIVEVLEKIL